MSERPFCDHSFALFLAEQKLMGSRCQACDRLYLPPRALCVECHGTDLEWTEVEGRGRLAAYTCISVPTPAMMAEGYDRKNPYCCGVVELAPGVRLDARIEGVDARDPESIPIGLELKARYLHRGEGAEGGVSLGAGELVWFPARSG